MQTRKVHPYLTKERFPANWATAEMVKQYLRNHRRYEVKHGRLETRKVRKRQQEAARRGEASGSSGLPDIDNMDEDEDNEDVE